MPTPKTDEIKVKEESLTEKSNVTLSKTSFTFENSSKL
jgi:hypothetical protein